MYLRITERRNRDGSTVTYYALAENVWNAAIKRSEARVVHNFGRADQLDRAALQRLVGSINRVLDAGESVASTAAPIPEIEIDGVFELGVVLAARHLWEELGIGPAIRRCIEQAGLTAPHATALFAMAAQRLEAPGSKLACARALAARGGLAAGGGGARHRPALPGAGRARGLVRGDRARRVPQGR